MKYSELQSNIIGIYKINFPNNKYYIGLSNNIKRRIYEHFKDGRNNMICHKAILKYYEDINDIDIDILETIEQENYIILSQLEKKWIQYYNTNNKEYGYNLTAGGISLLSVENPFAKINNEDLNIIRQLLIDGHSNEYISKLYGISKATVGRINNGQHYYDCNFSYPLRTNTSIERCGFNNHNAISKDAFDEIIDLLKNTTLTYSEISEIVLVDKSVISKINQGKSSYCPKDWNYPIRINNQNKTQLSFEDILNIHELLKSGKTIVSIAKQYNCSRDTISDIKNGKRHRIDSVNYPIKHQI